MPKYVFTEDEWMTWSGEYSNHTLKAVDGSTYKYVKGRPMDAPLPGTGDYDRALGVDTFGPGGDVAQDGDGRGHHPAGAEMVLGQPEGVDP